MRQRRREARARPTLPAWPERGLLGCPTRGGYRRDPESRVGGGGCTLLSPGGGGLLGCPWGPQVRLQRGQGGCGRQRHRPGGGSTKDAAGGPGGAREDGAAATRRATKAAGGGLSTHRASGRRPCPQPGGRDERSGRGRAPGRGRSLGRVAALLPGTAFCGSRLLRAARAQRRCSPHTLGPGALGGRGVCCPPLAGAAGAGPGTPIWPRARAATCGLALGRRHRLGSPPRSRAGLQRP